MKKIYFIEVKDFEEGDTLMNLAYDNKEDYNKSKRIIDIARCEWYDKEIDYCMSEYIKEHLEAENLLGLEVHKIEFGV